MAGVPNEKKPTPVVPDSYVPPGGIRRGVQKGETWITIASTLGMDPWDLIDFNFPGIKRTMQTDFQLATQQVNWYLREYVGCQTSDDGENWAFDSGLTRGKGGWKGGFVYTPSPKPVPPPPPPRSCSPTSAGKMGRRPTFYRLLNVNEQALVRRVFGLPFPYLDTVGIGNGLGFDGQPWTDTGPMSYPGLSEQLFYQINIGDAASADLTSNQSAGCFVTDISGTVSDLLIHEMTHVWQYYTKGGMTGRYRVWASSVRAPRSSYKPTPAGSWDSWDSLDVELQASIVEQWHHNGEQKSDFWYPYIKLVVRSRGDALTYASGLTLNELNRDLADLRARKLD